MMNILRVVLFVPLVAASPPCNQYGICKQFEFVPAAPGTTPHCAKPGQTFCEHIEHYPKQLIRYLIEKWGYDYNTLLSDESRDHFNDRRPPPYGVHLPPTSQDPLHYQAEYGSPTLIQPAISYGPITMTNFSGPLQVGYPDRRYKLPSHILTNAIQYNTPDSHHQQVVNDGRSFSYSTTVVQPVPVTQYDPAKWWKRYKRSTDSNDSKRPKRQNNELATTLCPTMSSFVSPRAALNTRGNWMYTVNLAEVDDRYTQLVRSETCISNECNGICSLPNGYSSKCEQQYVQKRLVALEGNGERLYSDTFWFPHCCVCQITQAN